MSRFSPAYHDHTLFFDQDGKIYMIWGAGDLHLAELKADLSGVKEGSERILIRKASAPVGWEDGWPLVGIAGNVPEERAAGLKYLASGVH